jgi:hypothetical protein
LYWLVVLCDVQFVALITVRSADIQPWFMGQAELVAFIAARRSSLMYKHHDAFG